MQPTRRELLYGATGVAGAGLLPAAVRQDERESGLVTGKPLALTYTELPGFLSKEQISWHHDSHYGGALKKFTQLDAAVTGDHRKRISTGNSVVLHELYFDNMTAADSASADRASAASEVIAGRFGSVDRWLEDFRAAAMSSRGWAVLAWQPVNGRLYNVVSDSHDDGPPWFGVPLVVVDMYEHSYYIDYQNRKADYVDGFIEHLGWVEIDRRVRAVHG
jgi:Fe-Mn family superoxide dismutase